MNQPAESVQGRNHPKRGTDLIAPNNFPLAYYNMPKAACTSIKNILFYIQNGSWFQDPLAIHKAIRHDNILLRGVEFAECRSRNPYGRDWTVFTFVRHPGKRAFSNFVEKIWADGEYSFPGVRKVLKANFGYKLGPMAKGEFGVDEVRQGFKAFLQFIIQNLSGNTSLPPNPHWMVQYQRIRRTKPFDFPAFVGRVESFENDMARILERAGWCDCSIVSRRFNEGPKPPFGLDQLADDEIRDLINRIYSDDFAAFDYEAC